MTRRISAFYSTQSKLPFLEHPADKPTDLKEYYHFVTILVIFPRALDLQAQPPHMGKRESFSTVSTA